LGKDTINKWIIFLSVEKRESKSNNVLLLLEQWSKTAAFSEYSWIY